MKTNLSVRYGLASATMLVVLVGCGGGGYSGDTKPSTPPIAEATAIDRFLLFPNPQATSLAAQRPYQTESEAYAQAYYDAIDPGPNRTRDTFEKWKEANKFDTAQGKQITVVFGDERDLGYGRRMTGRYNNDGTIAFFVENYVVNPGEAYGYSRLSLEAAAAQDTRWRIGINAIEFSPGPNGGASFAKFFNFNSRTGQRDLMVDLDFRGAKAMPGPCITCHGGRGDRLNSDGTFPLVKNAASNAPGDVQGHLAPFEVDTLDFLKTPGFKKEEQEDELRLMNLMVLCTYPLRSGPTVDTSCKEVPNASRRIVDADRGEWEAIEATRLITKAYSLDSTPRDTYQEPPPPDEWINVGESTLYAEVLVPACRMCHILRGTSKESDIDFASYDRFRRYADRIKVHVFDRGNMPLAKLVYDNFWDSSGPEALARFLENQFPPANVRDPVTGLPFQPGGPIADPGPDRIVALGPTQLSAAASLFADTYNWSIVSGPNNDVPPTGASVEDAASAQPIFKPTLSGHYKLQLIASKGTTQSVPKLLNIKVDHAQASAFATTRLSTVQQTLASCTSCHNPNDNSTPVSFVDANVETILSRINFTDLVASPLLRKPSGKHHSGGSPTGFNDSLLVGDPLRVDYDRLVSWIVSGAPEQ